MNHFYEVSEFVVLRWLCGFLLLLLSTVRHVIQDNSKFSLVDLLDIPALARSWIIWGFRFVASFPALSLEENEISKVLWWSTNNYLPVQHVCRLGLEKLTKYSIELVRF